MKIFTQLNSATWFRIVKFKDLDTHIISWPMRFVNTFPNSDIIEFSELSSISIGIL